MGHIVSAAGILPDKDKIDAVGTYPVPDTKTKLRSFLGLATFYSKFIQNFSHIACPLHALQAKNAVYQWTPASQSSFDTIKTKLTSAPVLTHPDFKNHFILHTDASDTAVGVALCQIQDDNSERPVAYSGRALTSPEKNYTTTEKELLAVVFGVEKFRPYVYGSRCTVFTDHAAIKPLLAAKDPERSYSPMVIETSSL